MESTDDKVQEDWSQPKEVTDVDRAFGRIEGLLPELDEIPEEFKSYHNPWCKMVEGLFYSGKGPEVVEREGVDSNLAVRHIQAVLKSWDCKHERKIYGVGYLMSRWFRIPRPSVLYDIVEHGDHLEVDVYAGARISHAAEDAVALAKERGLPVRFSFNDGVLTASEGRTAGDLCAEYDAELERRSAAYWTPERLAEKERKEDADREEVKRLVSDLDVLDLADLRQAIRWLCWLEECAFTHSPAPAERILEAFAEAGLYPNMLVRAEDESQEEWEEKNGEEGVMKWLIGQALDGVRHVGAPHQIVHSFAEKLGIKKVKE